jgi:prepilin-type N-terminal cleavage/methylation domain-containing protein
MKKGFTLIELMVAISIVALLATLGLVSFNSLQKNGRDTRRRSEVDAISSAIESTKNQFNLTYNFTSTMLANEFPPNAPAGAGLDPGNNYYCLFASSTSTSTGQPLIEGGNAPSSYSDTGAGSCGDPGTFTSFQSTPDVSTTLKRAALANGILNSASLAKSWVLCAYLESTTTPYCVPNKGSR